MLSVYDKKLNSNLKQQFVLGNGRLIERCVNINSVSFWAVKIIITIIMVII